MSVAATRRPVVVTHPVNQHAYQTALAAQHSGLLETFWTGVYRTGRGLTSDRALALLPGRTRGIVRRELARRWEPDLDPARIRTLTRYDLVSIAWRRLLRHPDWLWDPESWMLRHFDASVAARLRRRPPALVHAFEGAALSSFSAAREAGGITVLDCPSAHERFMAIQRATGVEHRQPATARIRLERRLADRLLAPSEQVVKCLIEDAIPPEKIVLLPYGADPARFRARVPSSGQEPFRVLFVGSIEARKGIRELLAAWRVAALPEAELVLIGPGGPRARRLLHDAPADVYWRGGVPRSEVPNWFAASDVFAFPSLAEGSALVTYEAMAAGLPSVVTAEAGSAVRDGLDGFVVPAADPVTLANRLRHLHSHPELREAMGRRARSAVEERWTWRHYEQKLTRVWSELLAEGSG